LNNYILLSHVIKSTTPSYGNRDCIEIIINSSIENGETANTSKWVFTNNHIGTHIDVPKHFSQNGKNTYEIPIENYIFNNVELVNVPCNSGKLISINDFKNINDLNIDVELLLIKTGYENYRIQDKYWNDNPGLSSELASYFRTRFKKLRCIGFDFISLTSWNHRLEGRLSHREFLTPDQPNGTILIIEDMSLEKIVSKINMVIVAPLFVEDGNGGAVTIFANVN
jgi:arylformamidase